MKDLIARLGGISAVARMAGVKPPTVHNWRTFPPDRVASIEYHVAGKVPAELLRPDLRWHRVADPLWPHPLGRPLLDHGYLLTAGQPANEPERVAEAA